jgi:hypothetical protein
MSELFRMTVVRRPKPAAVGEIIPLDTESENQTTLRLKVQGPNARAESIEFCKNWIALPPVPESMALEERVTSVLRALEEDELPLRQADILERLRGDANEPLGSVDSNVAYIADRIVALTVTGSDPDQLRRLGRYRRGLWIYQLVTETVSGIDAEDIDGVLERALRAPLTMPDWLMLPPAPPPEQPVRTGGGDATAEIRAELAQTLRCFGAPYLGGRGGDCTLMCRTNYLVDTAHAVILDVEATPARLSQAA